MKFTTLLFITSCFQVVWPNQLVPKGDTVQLSNNYASSCKQTYVVQSGNHLDQIIQKCCSNVLNYKELMSFNNKISDQDLLSPGDEICLDLCQNSTCRWKEYSNADHHSCGFPDRNLTAVMSDPVFRYTDIVLRPIWLGVCTLGNVANVILLRKSFSPQATLLTAIAGADLVFMWSWFALYIRDRIGQENIGSWDGPVMICEFIGNVALQTSDWMLVIYSAIRFRAVVFPLKMRNTVTIRRTQIAALAMVPFAVIIFIGEPVNHFMDFTVKPLWMENWAYVQEIICIVTPLVTFVIIFILNSTVLLVVVQRNNQTSKRTSSIGTIKLSETELTYTTSKSSSTSELSIETNSYSSIGPKRAGRKSSWAAISLLTASVVVYLISKIPLVSWQIIMQLEKSCKVHFNDHETAIFMPFYYQFFYINYSLNFFIYCGVSREYFVSFVRLVTHCGCCKNTQCPAKTHTLKKFVHKCLLATK